MSKQIDTIMDAVLEFFEDLIVQNVKEKYSQKLLEMLEGDDYRHALRRAMVAASKKLKDPDAPKRPMSAFLIFSQEERAVLKVDQPELKGVGVTAELSDRWSALKTSKKRADVRRLQDLKAKAEEKKAEYTQLKAEYKKPSELEIVERIAVLKEEKKRNRAPRKKRAKKPEGAPKNVRTAFQFFAMEWRKKHGKEEFTTSKERTAALSTAWERLSDTEMTEYDDLNAEDMGRYDREMADFESSKSDSDSKSDSVKKTRASKSDDEPARKKKKVTFPDPKYIEREEDVLGDDDWADEDVLDSK
jgi:hypothetical protein